MIGDEDFGRLTKMMQSVKPEGLGMGLSIVRGIADSHGAELEFKKGEKGGLIVLLTLEAGKDAAEEFCARYRRVACRTKTTSRNRNDNKRAFDPIG